MRISVLVAALVAIALARFGVVPGAAAQSAPSESLPLRGVVWEAPPDYEQAVRELRQMRAAGVEAVRTGTIRDERLLTLADTLGLALYQDLPAARLSIGGLRDTLRYATWELERALLMARGHPSARHFGLTQGSDTSDPAACAYLRGLARRVARYGPPGSRSYYVTAFAEDDPCANAVDEVLLDVRNQDDPQALLQRWRAARPDTMQTAVGLGALGTWVDPEAPRGLRTTHSPEAQARYLETHLAVLLDTSAADTNVARPAAVFVHRWRDRAAARPYDRRYGLHAADGTPRPAFRVVRGFYTGRQRVFAFPAGREAPGGLPWAVLLGWSVVTLLGVFYAGVPRFRRLVQRYFWARGFYHEAVREGRSALGGASIVLLIAVSLSAGLFATVAVHAVRETAAFGWLLEQLAAPMRAQVAVLLRQPYLLALLIGALHAVGLLLWSLLLTTLSRHRFALRPEQVLLLVVWPRWPMLLLMVGALVTATLPKALAVPAILLVAALWLLVALTAVGRTLYDYAVLTRTPIAFAAALALTSPLFAMGMMMLFVALEEPSDAAFFWHLIVRS